ncbi:MAG: hypothetical protein OXH99_22520 [Bryobacterales bacterium]|nr:hypothetical protein [Bryobacterales bacterium]
MTDLKRRFGYDPAADGAGREADRLNIRRYVRLRLAAGGLASDDGDLSELAAALLANYREQARLLLDHRCGADLRPETQDPGAFADGVRYITEAHTRIARMYFEDGSAEAVCPPLRALFSIMAFGDCDGLTIESPDFRSMFTRESVLASDWHHEHLLAAQRQAVRRSQRLINYVTMVRTNDTTGEVWAELGLGDREDRVRSELERVSGPDYVEVLRAAIGAQPFD